MGDIEREVKEYESKTIVIVFALAILFAALWMATLPLFGFWVFLGSYFLFGILMGIVAKSLSKKVAKYSILKQYKENPDLNSIEVDTLIIEDTGFFWFVVASVWITLIFYIPAELGEDINEYFWKPYQKRRAQKMKEKLIDEVQKENPEIFL
jgi:hypothetical protein